ncbi:helix-turn-helix domain-containing protein [Lacticaseibacillus paracasei]|nr:helix-turn-helix transcriptional regulator [Lacticaseibacillus paracasei]MBM6414019.1 helix-turn-helix transcriptional regulator [Lacticaseibacillus paracasei]
MKNPGYGNLKGWLVARKISQSEVAKLLGTTPNYVNKKLNGTGPDFRMSEARKLHASFGVPMAYFFEVNVPF